MSPGRTITVLVADCQRLNAEGLTSGMSERAGLRVIPEHPASAGEALEVAARLQPDVVILENSMPDMKGGAAVAQLAVRVPTCKVIVVAAAASPVEVKEVLEAGAAGFLPRSVGLDVLADAVRRVYAGEHPVYPEALENLIRDLEIDYEQQAAKLALLNSLTAREQEIVRVSAEGLPVEEIAERLFISRATAKTHINHILAKTNLARMPQVVALARECGWLG